MSRHRATPISPKTWYSGLGGLGAGVVLAVLAYITTPDGSNAVLGGLPPSVSTLVLVALPPIVAFMAAYAKRDPLRDLGQDALNRSDKVNPSA